MAELAAEVGPEFFGDVAEHVEHDVGAPDVEGVAEGALALGMVGVGDAGGNGVADDFGIIELEGAVIGASDKDAGGGVQQATTDSALAELEIARVLVQDGGEDRGGHERADAGVGVESGEALVVTREALAVGGVAVASLAEHGDSADEGHGDGIGHGFGGELEFGGGGKRPELFLGFDRGVVGEHAEEAMVGEGRLRWEGRRGCGNGPRGHGGRLGSFEGAGYFGAAGEK